MFEPTDSARIWDVPETLIILAVQRGRLPAYNIGGVLKVRHADIHLVAPRDPARLAVTVLANRPSNPARARTDRRASVSWPRAAGQLAETAPAPAGEGDPGPPPCWHRFREGDHLVRVEQRAFGAVLEQLPTAEFHYRRSA